MELTLQNVRDVNVAQIVGDLHGEGELTDLFGVITGPSARLVLDLSGVKFLSSAGIGDLVKLVAHANTQEARVALAAPSSVVANILEITHLNRFFEMHARVEDAIAALQN